jgi:hypothetical protein
MQVGEEEEAVIPRTVRGKQGSNIVLPILTKKDIFLLLIFRLVEEVLLC